MKALFSREYYEKNWDKFLEPTVGEHYINLEESLQKAMTAYDNIGLSDKDLEIVRKVEAQKIADKCRALVLEDCDVVKRIEHNEASFGMTTERQEIERKARFRKRFEFNCLQMRVFKEKYELQ